MPTITDLPPELVQHIASYLPSASAIVALGETCRSLHASISEDNYGIFRGFALTHFPSVAFPALWREATRALTTRSRAWDRKAFVGRVLHPTQPGGSNRGTSQALNVTGPRQKIGYAPAIDSYEEWTGDSWADRREVVAWGAGGRVALRTRRKAHHDEQEEMDLVRDARSGFSVETKWAIMDGSRGWSAHEDILDLRLLRPSQRQNEGEDFIIRRANNTVTKIHYSMEQDRFSERAFFDVNSLPTEAMDLSLNQDPLMAVCHPESLSVYHNATGQGFVSPVLNIPRSTRIVDLARARSLKFLSADKFAVAEQRLNESGISPVRVYQIAEDRALESSMTELSSNAILKPWHRMIPTAIAPVQTQTSASAEPGHVFLAGWSDGVVRLHDDRAPLSTVEYRDSVDDGMIASVMPIGEESFVAGGHQNACLKLFDLRMPGARPYSYLDARRTVGGTNDHEVRNERPKQSLAESTDINILLALRMNAQTKTYEPYKQHNSHPRSGRRPDRTLHYGGSVYSLSIPSPSSRTFFAGIENHVIQFDLASTDDIANSRLGHDWDLELDSTQGPDTGLLELAGYNRPPIPAGDTDQYVSMRKVELRRQVSLDSLEKVSTDGPWDARWNIPSHGRKDGRWNRG